MYRDWPRLKIDILCGDFPKGSSLAGLPGYPEANEPLVFIKAANVSRRPITIDGGGGLGFRDGDRILFNNGAHQLPAQLSEGQSITLWCREATLKKKLAERRGGIPTHVWFKDASDKLHRARISRGFRKWFTQLAGGSS